MRNYEHKKIIEMITRLDAPPSDVQTFAEWRKANAHLPFRRENADADEVAVYASGEYTFVHSLIAPNERLPPPDEDGLFLELQCPHVDFQLRLRQRTGRRMVGAWCDESRDENAARRDTIDFREGIPGLEWPGPK